MTDAITGSTNTHNREQASRQEQPTDYASITPKAGRMFDVVLFGATSFVGQLTAKYLAKFIKDKDINLAIAGRNLDKLSALSSELNNPNISLIIANSNEPQSLDDMTSQTKVIISTVGPYSKYGEALVKSCVDNGTDYVDLCGEMIFVRAMMDKYSKEAKKTGARIVSSCGFDSLPSDLGVHYLQQQSIARFSHPCQDVSLKVKAAKGGMSGGTVASMMAVLEKSNTDERIKQQVEDPYLLIDHASKPTIKQIVHSKAVFDSVNQRWQIPFIMEKTNTRVVHLSNYLSGFAYGEDFKYEELMWFPNTIKGKLTAKGFATVLGGFDKAVRNDKLRSLLTQYILPKPGTGPSVQSQESGYFDFRFFGYANSQARTTNQVQLTVKVTGQKDPGYAATAMMLSQAALCLAEDISEQQTAGGFWSPAAAMADELIERLKAHAMMTFEVIADK